jgi:PilZ domain
MALDVLPEAPCRIVCLLDDGAKTEMRLLGTSGAGRLQAELPVIDAREGGEILIMVERGRGGFLVVCRIDRTFFLGGLDGLVDLSVTSVTRRKPHRAAERISVDQTARIEVVIADHIPAGTTLAARMVDISPGGAAFLTEQPFHAGDQVRLVAVYEGLPISARARVANVSRQVFGRHRVGCEFSKQIPFIAHVSPVPGAA